MGRLIEQVREGTQVRIRCSTEVCGRSEKEQTVMLDRKRHYDRLFTWHGSIDTL